MRPGEAVELLGVGLANGAWVAARTGLELARYGRTSWWWRLRLALARAWLGDSPLRVLAREGPSSGLDEEDLVYGETLPGTAFELLELLEVRRGDCLVDLGCGRGVVPLVAGLAFGARAVGLEALEGFVRRGRRAVRLLDLDRVSFLQGDFRVGRLPRGSVYFLAGTSLGPSSWTAVTRRLAAVARPGVRAASLSQPLPAEDWEDLGSLSMAFSWGRATVFLHRRKGSPGGSASRNPRRPGSGSSSAHARSKGTGDGTA